MMLVQQYLQTHSLDDLARDHGVYARVAAHKFSLNYDQIEARDSDPIAQECRGLVLSAADDRTVSLSEIVGDTKVLARTMRRFFNYGQEAAANVDFDHADTRIYEKLDGTLCIVYFDAVMAKWCVATRSVPNADLPIDGFGQRTFTDLFWIALQRCSKDHSVQGAAGYRILAYADPRLTYCFELTTPENQVVVRYDDYAVTLLSVVDTQTGVEHLPDVYGKLFSVDVPVTHRLGSVAELLDFVSDRDPSAFEGVVVCDPQFNRVKVKSAGYLAFNKIKDNVLKSPRSLLEVILLEKLDDVSVVLTQPQKEHAAKVLDAYRSWVQKQNALFSQLLADVAEANEASGWAWEFGDNQHRRCFAIKAQETDINFGAAMYLYKMKAADAGSHPTVSDYIHGNKDPQHGWSNSFLDKLLRELALDSE